MYTLSVNMWFQKLMRQFFFGIDQIVYNFISQVYDLLMSIARTSILSQADILNMADRIYKLLAVFMIFKVTFSLITYVVNPDDFSDKSKGVAKLGTNIIISLALLILTPYVFNYAYRLQTIILEDNSLATLIFGKQSGEDSSADFLNTAGDEMAYITMSAFFTPNVSINELQKCVDILEADGSFNPECSGLKDDYSDDSKTYPKSLAGVIKGDDKTVIQNYVAGVEKENLGLMFRQELAVATTDVDQQFIMDYKFIFSTIVGFVIILLLITFCMDIALRSIKLAFLQLIAPIPIISYVDPKSGKDGMFKKWYQLCFKTYLSLFIRLLAIYFAVYIISRLGKMVDIVDGSYLSNSITDTLIKIFIIIGVLMFAKQLPKILEGLGIKLDGDGKFTLNPLKKFEDNAIGGKRLTGALGGAVAGAVGGHGVFGRVGSALTGSLRGAAANKGYKGGIDRQADVNRKLREARINGAGFWGSRAAVLSSRYGLDDADLEKRATNLRKNKRALELTQREVEGKTKGLQIQKKQLEVGIAEENKTIARKEKVASSGKALIDEVKKEVRDHKADKVKTTVYKKDQDGNLYQSKMGVSEVYGALASSGKSIEIGKVFDQDFDYMYYDKEQNKVMTGTIKKGEAITQAQADQAANSAEAYLGLGNGVKEYFDALVAGKYVDENGNEVEVKNADFSTAYATYDREAESAGEQTQDSFDSVKKHGENINAELNDIRKRIRPIQDRIDEFADEIKKVEESAKVELVGQEKSISYEKASELIAKEEKELEDIKKQRKLDRETSIARRFGGSQ